MITLDEMAKQLQAHVNNAVKNKYDPYRKDISLDNIHKLATAQKLVEEVSKEIGNQTRIVRLSRETFMETGGKVAHE